MPKNNRHGQALILEKSELAQIGSALTNPTHRMFWFIARFTGERWGAIAQLQVGDVYADPYRHIPRDYITFRKSTRKWSAGQEPETRQLITHPRLKDFLGSYRQQLPRLWLFESPYCPGHPITFSAADKWFRVAIARLGWGDRGISTHTTRRSFITHLYRDGVDLKVLQQITGHKDLKSLLAYVEVQQADIEAAIARY